MSKNFQKVLDSRCRVLQTILNEQKLLTTNILDSCLGARFTIVSYDGRNEALIDHIIFSVEKIDLIKESSI